MRDERKPTGGFWLATVLLTVLLIYPLSFGPAFWACSDSSGKIHADWTGDAFMAVYSPMIWTYQKGPKPLRSVLQSYLSLWGAP